MAVRIASSILGAVILSVVLSCGWEEETECTEFCLAVTEGFTFTDSDFRFHVTGKVKNFGGENARNVVVTVRFFSDSDHRDLLTVGSQVLTPIPPSEGWRTFDISSDSVVLLPGEGGLPAVFYEVEVSGSPGGGDPIPVPQLDLISHELRTDMLGYYHVRGKILNESNIPAEMVYFTVSFYRDEEKADLIMRQRKGFGRFLGTEPEDESGPARYYPTYLVDIWHPDINQTRYPDISYTAEISQ